MLIEDFLVDDPILKSVGDVVQVLIFVIVFGLVLGEKLNQRLFLFIPYIYQ